jgi:hypothetical protein
MDFHGEKRSNQTHASKTDPDAKMAGKGKEAKLSYNGNLLVDNSNGLIINTEVFELFCRKIGFAHKVRQYAGID